MTFDSLAQTGSVILSMGLVGLLIG